ncbi:STAS domain-containing protein [Streptomyces sp. TLI_146]|uniref:STAS domain-containing protein n=1 Tax=Streptomyces sp. TLI_146 TaxID=1938858 RepID=UPI000CAAF92A|nr:STAS domain-containing protein [Streptomyces sp. TLI_146]PKV89537.1 anti-anti-sigma factor [Streptomyces sp. TLI_146]
MPEHVIPAQLVRGGTTYAAPAFSPSGRPLPHLEIEVRPAGDRQLVVVTGEVDIDADHLLHSTLRAALDRSHRGIDLDLSKVDFCDCSGLNILLRIRQRALRDGKTLRVHAVSSAVHRLLTVTHTLPLLAPVGRDAPRAAPNG